MEAPVVSGTAEVILGAARRRMARFGARKTTMGEVAREAGCARATLYQHFPNKDALYAGLLEWETRAFLTELEAAVAGPGHARAKLGEIVGATLRVYAENPVLRSALAGDEELILERVAKPAAEAYETRVRALLRQVLDEGVRAGDLRDIDAEAVAYLMFQLGSVLVTREVTGRGDFAFERIFRAMDDLLSRGLTGPRPERT